MKGTHTPVIYLPQAPTPFFGLTFFSSSIVLCNPYIATHSSESIHLMLGNIRALLVLVHPETTILRPLAVGLTPSEIPR